MSAFKARKQSHLEMVLHALLKDAGYGMLSGVLVEAVHMGAVRLGLCVRRHRQGSEGAEDVSCHGL